MSADRRYCGKLYTLLRLISTGQRNSIWVASEGSVMLSKSIEVDTTVGVGRRVISKG